MNTPDKPSEHETDLVGQWIAGSRKLKADTTCDRIGWLVSEYLVPLSADSGGWDELYRDPETGYLWERSWPQPELNGGGPPRLARIEPAAARAKYGQVVDG
ncbi:MAG: Imm27 family immunity protein [Gammaproteobacteria bacterium]